MYCTKTSIYFEKKRKEEKLNELLLKNQLEAIYSFLQYTQAKSITKLITQHILIWIF